MIRPLLLDVLTGRKSLNQVISGSGLPLAAQSMVAVRERSTTFSWGPMSMVGNPEGSWSSEKIKDTSQAELDITYIFRLVAQHSVTVLSGEIKYTFIYIMFQMCSFEWILHTIQHIKMDINTVMFHTRHSDTGTFNV